jgi:hypothetical protein
LRSAIASFAAWRAARNAVSGATRPLRRASSSSLPREPELGLFAAAPHERRVGHLGAQREVAVLARWLVADRVIMNVGDRCAAARRKAGFGSSYQPHLLAAEHDVVAVGQVMLPQHPGSVHVDAVGAAEVLEQHDLLGNHELCVAPGHGNVVHEHSDVSGAPDDRSTAGQWQLLVAISQPETQRPSLGAPRLSARRLLLETRAHARLHGSTALFFRADGQSVRRCGLRYDGVRRASPSRIRAQSFANHDRGAGRKPEPGWVAPGALAFGTECHDGSHGTKSVPLL